METTPRWGPLPNSKSLASRDLFPLSLDPGSQATSVKGESPHTEPQAGSPAAHTHPGFLGSPKVLGRPVLQPCVPQERAPSLRVQAEPRQVLTSTVGSFMSLLTRPWPGSPGN